MIIKKDLENSRLNNIGFNSISDGTYTLNEPYNLNQNLFIPNNAQNTSKYSKPIRVN